MENKNWIEVARELKREKGISWTKLPGELYKETGLRVEAHRIRDAVRSYEASNGLAQSSKPEMSVVANLSDVHIGKKTCSTDYEKLCERIYYFFDEVTEKIKVLKKTNIINTVHINFIGDIIDNDMLYPSQPYHVDKGNAGHATQQIKAATLLFSEAINKFQKTNKIKVIINAVKGNHGRISKFTDESNNFDIMFYDSLELALDRNSNIEFNISTDFYNLFYVENHGFLLNHGNGVRMYQNIPWYGLVQRCMRWAGSLPNHFEYMIVGHFHTSGEQEWNDKTIYMNGTAVTDDNFAVEMLGLSASNKMWVFGVTKDNGIEQRFKIDLNNV